MSTDFIKKELDVFEQEAKKILDELNKNIISSTPVVYHYTNFKALSNIVKNKQLWLTDYARLNDPTEIIYSNNLIEDSINKYIRSVSVDQFEATFWE